MQPVDAPGAPAQELHSSSVCPANPAPIDNPLAALNRRAPDSLPALFPKTAEEIRDRVSYIKAFVIEALAHIIAIPADQRTFENTIKAEDQVSGYADYFANSIDMVQNLHPEKEVRDAAQEADKELSSFMIQAFSANRELYRAFREYRDGNEKRETLTPERAFYLEKGEKAYRKAGFHLSEADFAEATRLKEQLSHLCTDFSANIADPECRPVVRVKLEDLKGVPEKVISQIRREGDLYILTCDYNILIPVMEQCEVESTRKAMYHAKNNIAKEKNLPLLREIIDVRDRLARLTGYASYAHYDLDDSMAENPERAGRFIDEVVQLGGPAAAGEMAELHGGGGKIQPWNVDYLFYRHKKEKLSVDEMKISEYFPMEKTIDGLFSIYSKFFSITFKRHRVEGLWHPEAEVMEIGKEGKTIGYIVIDLHPREGKYSHACHGMVIPSQKGEQGIDLPAVSVVIANFDKPSGGKPSLLKLSEVKTFFHEFGHAIHALLGRTEMAGFSGTSVVRDFVEMPSQILEEWLWEPEILKLISSHYETGETLPDDLIESKIKARQFGAGYFLLRQMAFARMSLNYFGPGEGKDTTAIAHEIRAELFPFIEAYTENYMEANFGHLTGYGAKYYGYMWAKVFASAIFSAIRDRNGLLDPGVGGEYVDKIIGHGGSVDAKELVASFLGRTFTDQAVADWLEAFAKHQGLK